MADNPKFPIGTAAVNWFDSSGQIHVRVYSTDGYIVTERCIDQGGDWYTGSFSQPGSQVSATCWVAGGEANIRVYCTSDDTTTEWCNGPAAWTQGAFTTT